MINLNCDDTPSRETSKISLTSDISSLTVSRDVSITSKGENLLPDPLGRFKNISTSDLTNNAWTKEKSSEEMLTVRFKPDDFQIISRIGKGGFGAVYMVQFEPLEETVAAMESRNIFVDKAFVKSSRFAMKTVRKSAINLKNRSTIRHILNEKDVSEAIRGYPGVVQLFATFTDQSNLFFIQELVEGGDFYNLVKERKKLTMKEARFYMSELVSALGFIHSKNIIYRDMKPENLLIDTSGHLKIGDFGLAKFLRKKDKKATKLSTICGSYNYMAPEVLKKKSQNYSADWWSAGAVLFFMLNGFPPFRSSDDKEALCVEITSFSRFTYKWPEDIPLGNARDLISEFLIQDPEERLGGLDGVEEVKDHKFFSGLDWKNVARRSYSPPKFAVGRHMVPVSEEENNDIIKNDNAENDAERTKLNDIFKDF
jgi:serine/threonine protein kinase